MKHQYYDLKVFCGPVLCAHRPYLGGSYAHSMVVSQIGGTSNKLPGLPVDRASIQFRGFVHSAVAEIRIVPGNRDCDGWTGNCNFFD